MVARKSILGKEPRKQSACRQQSQRRGVRTSKGPRLQVGHALALDGPGTGEEGGVNRVDDRAGVNHPAAKISAVETFDSVFAALHFVKLEVDVALGVGINGNVDHVAILGLGLLPDVVLEFLDPSIALLPGKTVSKAAQTRKR